MGEKTEILFLLLGQLSVGCVVLLATISRLQLGLSFFKLNGLIYFLLMGVGIPGIPVPTSLSEQASAAQTIVALFSTWPGLTIVLTLAYSVCLFAYTITFWIKKDTHAVGWLFSASGVGLAMVIASAVAYAERMATSSMLVLVPVNFLLSTFVLGSGLLGMLLGHRYLTNPHLPMRYLNVLAWTFLIAVGLQGAMSVVNLTAGGDWAMVGAAFRLETFVGLFFWIRLAIGIGAPLILAAMIINTIRYQANMSATGLMYVALIMVMAGEAFSRYLLLSNSILL